MSTGVPALPETRCEGMVATVLLSVPHGSSAAFFSQRELAVAQTSAQSMSNPVRRVVTMLQKLAEKVVEEGEKEMGKPNRGTLLNTVNQEVG